MAYKCLRRWNIQQRDCTGFSPVSLFIAAVCKPPLSRAKIGRILEMRGVWHFFMREKETFFTLFNPIPSEVITRKARKRKEEGELLKIKCRLVFRKFDPLFFFADRRGKHQLYTPPQKEIIRNTYPTEHLEFDRRNYQKEGVGSRSNVKRKDLDLHSYLFQKKWTLVLQ